MKKKKLNLEELQVESFVTSSNLITNQTPEVKGGGTPIVVASAVSWAVFRVSLLGLSVAGSVAVGYKYGGGEGYLAPGDVKKAYDYMAKSRHR